MTTKLDHPNKIADQTMVTLVAGAGASPHFLGFELHQVFVIEPESCLNSILFEP